jgi:hypothetical protein
MPGSLLTLFALAISPIVTVIFASFYWIKRDPLSQPSIVAAIPFSLSSMAIFLAQSTAFILTTFNEIATQKTAGIRAVTAGLLQAERPLIWGLVDFGVCMVILFLTSAFLRFQRDEDTPLIHAYVSLPALIATTVFLVSLFLIVYLHHSTVDLVMKVVDTHRSQELASQYGTVSPGYFAATISSRFVATFFLSICQFCALIVVGVLDVVWRQKQNPRQAFAAVLTLGALVACGVNALDECGFVDYLLRLH